MFLLLCLFVVLDVVVFVGVVLVHVVVAVVNLVILVVEAVWLRKLSGYGNDVVNVVVAVVVVVETI